MKIRHDLEQGSTAWQEARSGLLTASEAKELLTPRFELRKGEMVQTLLARKLAERWSGPLMGFSSWVTEQGEVAEQDAFDAVQMETAEPLTRVGLIELDNWRAGCSPDGIIGVPDSADCRGLELKCPQPINHVKWLLEGGLPESHSVQVHFSLWLTGWKGWLFVSYRRGFPSLFVPVPADRLIYAKIAVAVKWFNDELDRQWARLVEINKGEPRDWRKSPEQRAEIAAAWERAGKPEHSLWPRPQSICPNALI